MLLQKITAAIAATALTLITASGSDCLTGAEPDCPTDMLCLYAATTYQGPRLTLTDCGGVDLRPLGWARRTRSIATNLPGGDYDAGTVGFYRSDGGTPSQDYRVLTLDPTSRTTRDAPDIDYLYHYC